MDSPIDNHSNKQIINKGKWNDKEITSLHQGVTLHGMKWTKVAEVVGSRLGKQCRERWINHEDPARKKTKWTKEEDQILIEQYKKAGSKWNQVASFLPGRSQNDIKNRWNAALKKTIEKTDTQQSKIKAKDKGSGSLKQHKMKNIQQKKNLKKVPFSPSSLASSNSPLLDSPLKEETPKVVKEQNQMILTAEALGLPDIFSPLKIELNLNDFELTNTILDDSSDFPTPTELFPTTPNFQNSNLNTSQNQLLQSPLTPKTPAWDQNLFDFINFYA